MSNNVCIKIIEGGQKPVYKHASDACADCYARLGSAPIHIKPTRTVKIPLGFALQLPSGYEAVIRPRSGNSTKGIHVHTGTIDSGYTGELAAIITNLSDETISFANGDRVCQLKIQKAEQWNFVEVEELNETDRGDSGFGSTGLK